MRQRFFLLIKQESNILKEEVDASFTHPVFFLLYLSVIISNVLYPQVIQDQWVVLMILIKMSLHDILTYEIYETDQILLLMSTIQVIDMNLSVWLMVLLSIGLLVWMCRQNRLGCADVKLLVSGVFMVQENWVNAMFLSSILASGFGLIQKLKKEEWIPFGPFIALSLFLFLK